MEKQQNLLGYGGSTVEEQTSCFFTNSNNWDFNPMDQNDPFESALSSMVSSPNASSGGGGGGGGGGGENVMLRELIGRLGSICSSGDISPHSYNNNNNNNVNGGGNTSTNTTCYSTPLNSPPKLNLSVMDYQIRGNLPFSGTHLVAANNPSLIAPFPPDPGFADRAARYSCFANKKDFSSSLNGGDADFGQNLIPKISGASSSNWSKNVSGSQMDAASSMKPGFSVPDKKISKFSRPTTPENSGIGDSMEISSLTEQITGGQNTINAPLNEANPRKRKSIAKGKAKEPTSLNSSKDANVASEKTDTNSKRSKSEEDNNVEEKDGTTSTKIKTESNGTSKSTRGDGNNKKQIKDDEDNKQPEPPKDYIHVRARRGQATDAHSLAERVRREKISERMKLLQNLVPGCNMVTGKAVMLDEIINYVQSLQHQVEFLSMKLATINPRSDLNVEAHLSKDVYHNIYPSNASVTEFPHSFYPPQGGLSMQNTMPNGIEIHQYAMNNGQNTSIQMPSSDNFGDVPSQVPAFWGNDLHSVVQMGLNQNQTENFHDNIMSTAQMKIEK